MDRFVLSLIVVIAGITGFILYEIWLSNPNCLYSVLGTLLVIRHHCVTEGTPTVISQLKEYPNAGQLLADDYESYKREILHMWCQGCDKIENVSNFCNYDSNGEFVPHLSDAQKTVILDFKNSFSLSICPFTGKPNHP